MAPVELGFRFKLRMRSVFVAAAGLSIALVLTLLWVPRPLLIWNATPSSPIGLYILSFARTDLAAGDFVIAWPPQSVRSLASERNYLPSNVPLVKRVAAQVGDRVCAKGSTIFVNGHAAAVRTGKDPSGRRMPWWSGCLRLHTGELLLLSANRPDAFDGRYFGLTSKGEIIGGARLLWSL